MQISTKKIVYFYDSNTLVISYELELKIEHLILM